MRCVFISGASSDIGVELCRRYLDNGWRVVAHYNAGQPSFWDLARSAPHMETVKIDFSNEGAIEHGCQAAAGLIATCDALVNAAAVMTPKRFDDVTGRDLVHAFTVNVIPAVLLMKHMIPGMKARGWGRIVNLSSIGVKFGGGTTNFVYSLTKSALEFIPGEYKEWARLNILVNAVRVGVTDTRIHRQQEGKDMSRRIALIPMGRMASPAEMAKVIYWYGSDENTFITGQTITVAGGE